MEKTTSFSDVTQQQLLKKALLYGLNIFVDQRINPALPVGLNRVEDVTDADMILSSYTIEMDKTLKPENQIISFTSSWIQDVDKEDIDISNKFPFGASGILVKPFLVDVIPSQYSGSVIQIMNLNVGEYGLICNLIKLANAKCTSMWENTVQYIIYGPRVSPRQLETIRESHPGVSLVETKEFLNSFGVTSKLWTVRLASGNHIQNPVSKPVVELMVYNECSQLIKLLTTQFESEGFQRYYPSKYNANFTTPVPGTQLRIISTPRISMDNQRMILLLQKQPNLRLISVNEIPASWDMEWTMLEILSHHTDSKTAKDFQQNQIDRFMLFLHTHIIGTLLLETCDAREDGRKREVDSKKLFSFKYIQRINNAVILKSEIEQIGENLFRVSLILTSAILTMLMEMTTEYGSTPTNPKSLDVTSSLPSELFRDNWAYRTESINVNDQQVHFRNGCSASVNASISQPIIHKFAKLTMRGINLHREICKFEMKDAVLTKTGIQKLCCNGTYVFISCRFCSKKMLSGMNPSYECRKIKLERSSKTGKCINCNNKCKNPSFYIVI